jgi:hypothetical protein
MPVTAGDTLKEILRPLTSCLMAVGIVLACSSFIHPIRPPLLRLFVENGVLFGVYFIVGLCNGPKEHLFADASGPRSLAYRQTAEANRHDPFPGSGLTAATKVNRSLLLRARM